jgi:very-short-patch-repair endonuclease
VIDAASSRLSQIVRVFGCVRSFAARQRYRMTRRYQPLSSRHAGIIAQRAHGMRQSLTPSERALRAKRLGVAFCRQVTIGYFIADFVAPSAKLIVEVDGMYRGRRAAADSSRDRKLHALGYRILRLDADLVTNKLAMAVERIREELRK